MLWAAVLCVGSGGALSHETAAEVHGLIEDTVLDLVAAAWTFDDAYGWISRAIGRQLTSPQLLSQALAGRSRMRWRAWIAAHPAENRWPDTHRDNANLVAGTRTLRYGWPDTTERRCRTAVEIAALLRRQGWKGTLRPCSPTCPAAKTLRRG